MSEEIKQEAVESEVEAVDTPTDEKTVPLSELQRRLAQADEKHQAELQAIEDAKQKAIEDAVAKAKMTESELKALQKKEKEEELAKAQSEIETLRKQIALGQLKDRATAELSARNIPVTDKHLALVTRDSEEDTLIAIEMLSDLLTQQKRESSVSTAPITSGGMTTTKSQGGFKDIIQSTLNNN